MEKESLEIDYKNKELVFSEEKFYSFWKTLTGKDRKCFLEDSLKLLEHNLNFLKKASFMQDYTFNSRNDPVIYHKIPKFSKINLIKSSLEFPLGGKEISIFIKEYFSGNLVLDQNPNYGWPGGGSRCDFPDNFYIYIKNIGSVKYSSGFFNDSLFFPLGIGNRFTSSLIFEGIGNLESNPRKNIDELKKYYKGLE